MDPWHRSTIRRSRLEGLVRKGLLHARTDAQEWRILGDEDHLDLPPGYIISFAVFHERRFATPPHRFFCGLLHYYGVELQHLNPNRIQHIAAFMAMCKGYLGVEPHFELWKYFFTVSLFQRREKRSKVTYSVPMGCVSIRLRQSRASEYMPISLSTSNKGWHGEWFYLKNDSSAPLLAFTGRYFPAALRRWEYGPVEDEKRRLVDSIVFKAIQTLKDCSLRGIGVIGGYHVCRLTPLMARSLLMYKMTPDAPSAGTVVSDNPDYTGLALSVGEIEECLWEATYCPPTMSS